MLVYAGLIIWTLSERKTILVKESDCTAPPMLGAALWRDYAELWEMSPYANLHDGKQLFLHIILHDLPFLIRNIT